MNEFFKVYDSLIKYGYLTNLFELAATNNQLSPNGVHMYVKNLYEQNEQLNSQAVFNSQEKNEFISIIHNLNVEIINLKGEIERLSYEITNIKSNPPPTVSVKSATELAEINELTEQNENLNKEINELIEHRTRLQKSNAFWINTIFRFMMKTSLRQKYSSEILQMQDIVINNFKDTPKVVERTNEIINEFFKKV
jgi:hypothetical protein